MNLILLPTLECNAACCYCFENKNKSKLSHDDLIIIIRKVLEYLDSIGDDTLDIHWQGGELTTLSPEWYLHSMDIIQKLAESYNKNVMHHAQTNLLDYNKDWYHVYSTMFQGCIGTSLDYPNLYRKPKQGTIEDYNAIIQKNLSKALEDGLHVGVISVPNEATLEKGAEAFYKYYVETCHLTHFQINNPFPGGNANEKAIKQPFHLQELIVFYKKLADIVMNQETIFVAPLSNWIEYFLTGILESACVWNENCAKHFFCIDPHGNIAQCDCWVTSYPNYHYGNILTSNNTLLEILSSSSIRKQFLKRPEIIIQTEDCLDCPYLALCHGGCPIRTYTITGTLYKKDPYCELYRTIFSYISNELQQKKF